MGNGIFDAFLEEVKELRRELDIMGKVAEKIVSYARVGHRPANCSI